MSFKRLVNGIKATPKMKKINDDKDPSFRVNYVCKKDVITQENKILFIYLFCYYIECCKKIEFQLDDGKTDTQTLGLIELRLHS